MRRTIDREALQDLWWDLTDPVRPLLRPICWLIGHRGETTMWAEDGHMILCSRCYYQQHTPSAPSVDSRVARNENWRLWKAREGGIARKVRAVMREIEAAAGRA